MGIVIKAKVSPADLLSAKRVLATEEIGSRVLMGYIIGRAKGFDGKVDAATGNYHEFLIGEFEAIPATEVDKDGVVIEKDTTSSGKCFLPDAMHQLVKTNFVGEDGNQIKGLAVDFAYEVYSERATNKAGYTYAFLPKGVKAGADPLAAVRALLSAPQEEAPKLEAPKAPAKK